MVGEIGKLTIESLSFFGAANRLISHELKNIFAIISETLGLIDELIESPGAESYLKSGKFQSLSESVIEEIERANRIVKNMNTFAHSVDTFINEVDIRRLVETMIGIFKLNATSKNIEIHLLDHGPCVITTIPVLLQRLIYQIFKFSLDVKHHGNEIAVSPDSDDHNVKITFSGIPYERIVELNEKQGLLLKLLSATFSLDASAHALSIHLPRQMDERTIIGLSECIETREQ